jgi:hypothetical protein
LLLRNIVELTPMRTVIELPEFYKKADKIFGESEREKIIEFLSNHPNAGKRLENFGGIRKLEWLQNDRIPKEHNIYFHSGSNKLPLVVITIFRKNEKMILDKLIEILLHSKIR